MKIVKYVEKKFDEVNFNNLYLRTDSYNKNLHSYSTRVCFNCGVVYQHPQIKLNDAIKSTMKRIPEKQNIQYI